MGGVFLCILLFVGQENFNAIYKEFKQLTAGIKGGTLSLILKYAVPFLVIIGIGGFSILYIKKHGFNNLKTLIVSKVKSLILSIISIKDIKEKPQFLLLTIAMWLSYLVMFYVNYKALPETSNLPFSSALVCLFFGSLSVVLTPGGIGIFPIVIQTILVAFSIQPSIALAIGMIAWAVQTLGVLIGGVASLIALNLTNKK